MYLEFRQGKPQGTFLLKEMLARIGDSETRIFRIAEAPFFSFSCVCGGKGRCHGVFPGFFSPKLRRISVFFYSEHAVSSPSTRGDKLFFEFGKNGTNMEIRNSRLDFSRIRVYILLKFGISPVAEFK
jgi:hypothetical protein